MHQLVLELLSGMVDAYWKTLAKAEQFADDPNSYEAFSASHNFRVAHWELYGMIHQYRPKFRANINGFRVVADQEGGLAFLRWSERPFDARKAVESWN